MGSNGSNGSKGDTGSTGATDDAIAATIASIVSTTSNRYYIRSSNCKCSNLCNSFNINSRYSNRSYNINNIRNRSNYFTNRCGFFTCKNNSNELYNSSYNIFKYIEASSINSDNTINSTGNINIASGSVLNCNQLSSVSNVILLGNLTSTIYINGILYNPLLTSTFSQW